MQPIFHLLALGLEGFALGLEGFALGLEGFALGLEGFALGLEGFALAFSIPKCWYLQREMSRGGSTPMSTRYLT